MRDAGKLIALGPFIAIVFATGALIAAPPTGDSRVVPDNATVEELWNEGEFTEGVAVGPEGAIYFSDIPTDATPGRVLKFDPATKKTSVYCADSGKSNGLMFDREGRLIAACGANAGHCALCEITADGEVRPLAVRFEGRFNSPNDLVIHPDGSIYFTDPRYIGEEPLELSHMSVYRFDPSTRKISRASTDIPKPNGIVCSPDGKTLYVALTDNGSEQIDGAKESARPVQMKLIACRRRADGTLANSQVVVDFQGKMGIDGMTVDLEGNIYAAVRDTERPGIAVFTPQGKEIAHIPTGELPTNCCFGRGEEASMLYITAGGGLYRVPLTIPGFHPATTETP